jgi:hypothetical protein
MVDKPSYAWMTGLTIRNTTETNMSDVFTLSVRLEGAAFTDAPELAAIVRSVADTLRRKCSTPTVTRAAPGRFSRSGTTCAAGGPPRSATTTEPPNARGLWAATQHLSSAPTSFGRGYGDGDPLVTDMCLAPLCGEWSGGMTPE